MIGCFFRLCMLVDWGFVLYLKTLLFKGFCLNDACIWRKIPDILTLQVTFNDDNKRSTDLIGRQVFSAFNAVVTFSCCKRSLLWPIFAAGITPARSAEKQQANFVLLSLTLSKLKRFSLILLFPSKVLILLRCRATVVRVIMLFLIYL